MSKLLKEIPSQTHKANLADLGFRLIPPNHPVLHHYVRSYWRLRRVSPMLAAREEYMHPNGGFGIVFNFGDVVCLDGQAITEPVFLDSANTVSRRLRFTGHVDQIGINFFEGGAYPFLAIPLGELRNQTALLDALDRTALMRLYVRLYESKSLSARIALLEQWLLNRLSLGKKRDALIPASLRMLRNARSELSIPELARQLSISQRQLQRLYHSQVGMTPKQYTRLVRVETARLALKQMSNQTNTQLAANLGFFDQSHFIREFSAVVGMTPYTYMQRSRKRKT